jgi:hypothetical protein
MFRADCGLIVLSSLDRGLCVRMKKRRPLVMSTISLKRPMGSAPLAACASALHGVVPIVAQYSSQALQWPLSAMVVRKAYPRSAVLKVFSHACKRAPWSLGQIAKGDESKESAVARPAAELNAAVKELLTLVAGGGNENEGFLVGLARFDERGVHGIAHAWCRLRLPAFGRPHDSTNT